MVNTKIAIDLSELSQREVVIVKSMLQEMGLSPLVKRPHHHYSLYYITNIDFCGDVADTYFYCLLDNIDRFDKDHFISYYELEEIYDAWKGEKK